MLDSVLHFYRGSAGYLLWDIPRRDIVYAETLHILSPVTVGKSVGSGLACFVLVPLVHCLHCYDNQDLRKNHLN